MNLSVEGETSITWRGVPLSELYGSHSPWGAPEFPLVTPSHNHTVLYHISSNNEYGEQVPKPQVSCDKWEHNFVRMPCSNQSLYPVEVDGDKILKKRWEMIEEALQKPIKNTKELTDAILSYNTKFKSVWRFKALYELFDENLEEEESEYFFNVTLPDIAKLALSLPRLIQHPIPLLRQHKNQSLSLSQQQISCLLANAFFCTFPRRCNTKRTSEYVSYPNINFNRLYESSGSESVIEKLKSICHYFRRVTTKVPLGVMTFTRKSVPPNKCPDWSKYDQLIGGTPLHVDSSGTIEDNGVGLIQVDFANKYLGGGVLSYGCVQEEIRFVICPELLVSMLFTELLRPNEALLMIGCERFSSYGGYGGSFRWTGPFEDDTPRDSSNRLRTVVLAIDALPFRNHAQQYTKHNIERELNKAWVGMCIYSSECEIESGLSYPGVATGNWGCGAFGGHPGLKSLLQLMAATAARRPLAYFTFGDIKLRNDIINMYNLLAKHNVTVAQLYKYLIKYSEGDVKRSQLHPFIHQTIIDEGKSAAEEKMDVSTSSLQNETKPNCSPDLFSQEDEESVVNGNPNTKSFGQDTFEYKIINETISNSDSMATETNEDAHMYTDKRSPSRDAYTHKEKGPTSKITNHTFKLFSELEKLDKENGKLNLGITVNDTEIQSTVEDASDELMTAESVPTDIKKKIDQKHEITQNNSPDLFSQDYDKSPRARNPSRR